MTLKEALDAQWNKRGCRNPRHLNRWFDMWNDKTRAYFNVEGDEFSEQRLMAHRGRLVALKLKRSKYRGATQPWLTPNALQHYRVYRSYVEKHGYGIHGSGVRI